MKTMNAVVTGATGCVGMNFLKHLSEQGGSALALVRPGSERIKDLLTINGVSVVECDLANLAEITSEDDFDVFYHFGWENTEKSFRDAPYKQKINITYTLDAVKLAAKLGCQTFVGAGSQAEYGRIKHKIYPDTPTNPDSAYGAAKLCTYKLSQIYANSLNIRHVWARIFSVYGPYDNPGTLISSSIIKILRNETPQFTKGEQQWDFLYAEDLARALYLLGEKGVANSVYCVGSGQTKLIREYIELLKNKINPDLSLSFGGQPYRNNQVMNLCADIDNLTKDTGFLPEISFEVGIARTIDWFKQFYPDG